MKVAGVVLAGIASWIAVPWIDMARNGTLDQRAAAAWRAEPRRPRPTPDLADVIPVPRTSVESAPTSTRSA